MSSDGSIRRFSYSASTLIPVAAAVALTPCLTRLFPPAEYGQIAWASLVVQFVGLSLTLGQSAQIILAGNSRGVAHARLLWAVVGAVSLVVTLIAVGVASLTVPATPVATTFVLALAGAWVSATLNNALSLSRLQERPGVYAGILFGSTVMAPAVAVVMVPWASCGVHGYLLATYVGTLAVLAWAALCLRGPWRGDMAWLGRQLRCGLPYLPFQLAMAAAPFVIVTITMAHAGPSRTGEIQLGLYLASICTIAVNAANATWLPWVLAAGEGAHRARAVRGVKIAAWLMCAVVTGLSVFAPTLAVVLASDSYDRLLICRVACLASFGGPLAVVWTANSHLGLVRGATRRLAVVAVTALGASSALVWCVSPGRPVMAAWGVLCVHGMTAVWGAGSLHRVPVSSWALPVAISAGVIGAAELLLPLYSAAGIQGALMVTGLIAAVLAAILRRRILLAVRSALEAPAPEVT